MRVLFHLYSPSAPRRASIQQSIRVCYFLAKAGASVHLHICTGYFKCKKDLLKFFGFSDSENLHVRFYSFPFRNLKNEHLVRLLGLIFHVRRFLQLLLTSEKDRYDVFFARGYRFPALHVLFKSILKYKVVYEFHEINYLNDVAEDELLRTKQILDAQKYAYRKADGVIIISNSLRELAEKKWGPSSVVRVIRSGAILFESSKLSVDRTLSRIYFVGNYYPLSGIDFLLRALVNVPNGSLTIVGGGGNGDRDYRRVTSLVKQLGLEDRVRFAGFVEPHRLSKCYEQADILVMPYAKHIRCQYFASPLKLFEYMSARRPIIASDLPAIREVLRDGENAVLAEPEDSGSLAAAIVRVMRDRGLAVRISERAYQDARGYCMENKCDMIMSMLKEIVG